MASPVSPYAFNADAPASTIPAPAATDALVVAAVPVLLALLWLYFTSFGRDLAPAILGRNASTPYAHPLRVRFLDEVGKSPGITRSELAARASISPMLARYHLRYLRKAGLLDVVRNGNRDAYMLNHSSFRFYLPTAVGGKDEAFPAKSRVLVAHALASLNHPTRRRICDVVRQLGQVDYARWACAWRDANPGEPVPLAQEFSYHAGVMARAGLLARRRDGRRVFWMPNIDLEAAFRQAGRRLGTPTGGA